MTSGRSVSNANYFNIANGLSQSRKEVHAAFRTIGRPATANEITLKLNGNDLDHKNVNARITELINLGLLRVVDKVSDPVSGYLARRLEYVASADAVPLDDDKPNRKQLLAQIDHLQQKLFAERQMVAKWTAYA